MCQITFVSIRYEKYSLEPGKTRYATVGFSTVYQYYAYLANTRPRIAQMLILPPFQGKGLGVKLLEGVYSNYIGCNNVIDITGNFHINHSRDNKFSHFSIISVEDPAEDFQRLRDFVDAKNCSTLPSFAKSELTQKFNKQMATEAVKKFKINKVFSCFDHWKADNSVIGN